jgi:hemerythrin-like domain-containing protein
MKRHPALRALSSDHHQGLVQARRLVQAAQVTPAGAPAADLPATARAFLGFWNVHTRPHFREEEEVLLPAFARYGDPATPPVMRLLLEHVQIRRLVADLQRDLDAGQPLAATMQAIGELLRAHIRHEEDVVFPLIEQALPEAALAALPAQLAASTLAVGDVLPIE